MKQKAQFLIIGGGVAGLSVAYHLAKAKLGPVILFEREKKLGGHASGRNAGMIRQAVEDPALIQMAIESRKALSRWKGIGFRNSGSLLLAKNSQIDTLKKIHTNLIDLRVGSKFIERPAAVKKVSFLRNADFEKALFCSTDASVDIDLLLKCLYFEAKKHGARIKLDKRLKAVAKVGDGFRIEIAGKAYEAPILVNAAGAWAGEIGRELGALAIPFKAYRRHIFFTAGEKTERRWPFVWDLSAEFYFRPLGRSLLLSPCDKDLFELNGKRSREFGEMVEPTVKQNLLKKMALFSPSFVGMSVQRGLAGLRSMTDDGRFVIGEDPRVKGFFWVAGLGGHGMTTCLSVGRLTRDLLLNQNTDKQLAKAFSPSRFE